MKMGETWTWLGSTIGSFMFIYAMFQQYFPLRLLSFIEKYMDLLVDLFNPYIDISFHEFTGANHKRSEVYTLIEAYLSANSSKQAKRLKANIGKNSEKLLLSMDDYQEVEIEYEGVKLLWSSDKILPSSKTISYFSAPDQRYYTLKFHKRYQDLIVGSYLNHVLEEGKAIGVKNRQRKLYTNEGSDYWTYVVFNHPATFQTLAMDPKKKNDIINDLINFSKAKDYYAKIGKAWKRGYLLYGPPGTGKSSMIAAMANLLDYDVYDLELTTVNDNTELRKLLIEIPSKSIIMIEDIDCSLDLTGQRKEKKGEDGEEIKDPVLKKAEKESKRKKSQVTLSGLLNFIDGLWSACTGERIIVLTTNYIEKLDPALIRRGRMDMHLELSYCNFEGFKMLANNYLDLGSHHLFEKIRILLEKTQMTPADVAENLMLKTVMDDTEACLENLIQALETKLKEDDEKAKAKECEPESESSSSESESSSSESSSSDSESSSSESSSSED